MDSQAPNAIYNAAKGSSVQPVSFTDDTAGSASPIIGHSRSTSSRSPRPAVGRLALWCCSRNLVGTSGHLTRRFPIRCLHLFRSNSNLGTCGDC